MNQRNKALYISLAVGAFFLVPGIYFFFDKDTDSKKVVPPPKKVPTVTPVPGHKTLQDLRRELPEEAFASRSQIVSVEFRL